MIIPAATTNVRAVSHLRTLDSLRSGFVAASLPRRHINSRYSGNAITIEEIAVVSDPVERPAPKSKGSGKARSIKANIRAPKLTAEIYKVMNETRYKKASRASRWGLVLSQPNCWQDRDGEA